MKIKGSVVVITGASSGIGRATALAFARKGADVVVAARRVEPLEATAADCRAAGARALAVPTDVTDADAVDDLARRAVEEFGHVDVWFNNAGVFFFAPFEEAPLEDFRRVLDVNLLGTVHGTRAALRVMRPRGSGVVINNASVYGKVAAPFVNAYVASKFAIVGLTESVREELLLDDSRIAVCTLLPASIDTPIYDHTANFTGRQVKPVFPTYDVEGVAKAVVDLARHPRREVVAGSAGRLLRRQRRLSPAAFERVIARYVDRQHFTDQPAPMTSGSLFEPVADGTGTSGGWKSDRRPLLKPVLVVGAAALGARWYLRSRGTG